MGIYHQKRKDGTTYGTYVIDRIVLGSRLKISTGSNDLKTVRRMDDLIDELKERGFDVHLRNLVSRKITIRQLYDLKQKGTLFNSSYDPQLLQPFYPTFTKWMDSYKGWKDTTRKTNQQLFSSMLNKLGSQIRDPVIQDIPVVLRTYRDICEREDTSRSFNVVRSCFQRFVRVTLGKSSTLYVDVSDVERVYETPKNRQRSRTPGQIEKLCRSLPSKFQGMVWTMCTTGVGWDEYGKMIPRDDLKNPRIYIEGTKMDKKDQRRRREVPFVWSPRPRVGTERNFRKILGVVSTKLKMERVGIYTFRKCYSNWLGECGVPQWRVNMYCGHQPKTQTQQYQTTEVWRWLKEDGERLRKWIEENRRKKGSATTDFAT